MENKRLIVLFGIIFSLMFSLIYYVLFSFTMPKSQPKRTLYMDQVGLYEKKESVTKMKKELAAQGFVCYEMKQDKLTAVVCGVSTSQSEQAKNEARLKKLNISYVPKNVQIEDEAIGKLIDQKAYGTVLERIGK